MSITIEIGGMISYHRYNLSNIRELRNDCCHGTSFKHNQEQKLRKLLFDDEVFKNLKVGKKIAENMKKSIK